jgi:hypothetical protein
MPEASAVSESCFFVFQALSMTALRAHVGAGQLVLDEPTNLPEGEVVELVPLDEVLVSGVASAHAGGGPSRSRK